LLHLLKYSPSPSSFSPSENILPPSPSRGSLQLSRISINVKKMQQISIIFNQTSCKVIFKVNIKQIKILKYYYESCDSYKN
jgi:hypothetical protein